MSLYFHHYTKIPPCILLFHSNVFFGQVFFPSHNGTERDGSTEELPGRVWGHVIFSRPGKAKPALPRCMPTNPTLLIVI